MLSLMIVSDLISAEMSDVLEHELISISVVIQGLISEFLTLNDFILKLDVGQFIGGLFRSESQKDPITTLTTGASLNSKRSSSERALGKKTL